MQTPVGGGGGIVLIPAHTNHIDKHKQLIYLAEILVANPWFASTRTDEGCLPRKFYYRFSIYNSRNEKC